LLSFFALLAITSKYPFCLFCLFICIYDKFSLALMPLNFHNLYSYVYMHACMVVISFQEGFFFSCMLK
jgi:hypothetical protein